MGSPRHLLLFPATAVLCASLALADDWPQYNGSTGDRTVAERVALRAWPAEGPPVVWRAPTERGFSSFAVVGDRAYTLVQREVEGAPREVCVAFDAESGEELWAAALGESKYDGGGDSGTDENKGGDGPRSTPSVVDGRLYAFDAYFGLFCLDPATGETNWSHDLKAGHGAGELRWQNAASPLVDGGRVYAAGGGAGEALLAFDAATGEVVWKTGDEKPTHATPVAATIHGVRQVIFFVQSGLVSVAAESGEELWRAEYPFRISTAASPVVYQDVVYCSAGYGVGGGAFVIVPTDDGGFEAELLWQKRNKLQNHWSTPVVMDGYLYGMFGFKEYGECPLKCVELATGEEHWSVEGYGPGNCILVGDTLVALSDAGELVLVEATPDEYRELARADVLEGKCWSTPVYADGQVYARSTREGVRVDLTD